MPRLSTSDRAKARVLGFLKSLLMYANHERDDWHAIADRLIVKWLNEEGRPRLLVQANLNTLVELAFPTSESGGSKEQMRHDLRLLKEFLKILDDHRLKTQGAEIWHFTLNLWSKSTQRNLDAVEREWTHRKQLQSSRANEQPGLPATASARSAELNDQIPTTIHRPGNGVISRKTLPWHNLPARAHTAFIGSKSPIAKLLNLLSAHHPASMISIEGVGGIGKTALVLEIAHRCLLAAQNPAAFPNIPTFDAIIFVSAKTQHLIGGKLSQRLQIESSLRDIFRIIFRTFDALDTISPALEEQVEQIRSLLSRQQTLLIVDNLETLEEQEYVLSFLYELPSTVKVVCTSRIRFGVGTTIALGCLSVDDSLALIQHYAQEKAVQISSVEAQALYQQSGGLPLAIAYGMGQIAVYGSIPKALPAHPAPTGNALMQYCFQESVPQLEGQPAYYLLLALAFFVQPASNQALEHVALLDIDPDAGKEGLAKLHRLSLVERRHEYYELHPLTRSYISMELSMHPDFEQDARNRWVNWYLNFLEPYGETNWRDWQEFASLEQEWENLQAVIEWCKIQDRYDDFKKFWQPLKSYTQLYGHWHQRLAWMDWLIEAAAKRQDTVTLIDALYHASRTLYLFNQPEHTKKAIAFGHQAWELAQTQANWVARVDLTVHLAALCSQQQQSVQALDWLNLGENLLQQFAQNSQAELYQWVDIDYYKAEICLRNQDYQQAKHFYTKALETAEAVGWQRAVTYIKGGQAAIAIAQGDLSEAATLLEFVLVQANQHNDKRCLSFCQNYWALLEQERGNQIAAQQWAQLAKGNFERLDMQQQASELEVLLKH